MTTGVCRRNQEVGIATQDQERRLGILARMQRGKRWGGNGVGNSRQFSNITATVLELFLCPRKYPDDNVRELDAADVRAIFGDFCY